MGILLPAIGSCSFATPGERRFAERLIEKLADDSLCWYDVPMGPHRRRPDFVVFHPQHGLLVLEVKDWNEDTIKSIDRLNAVILDDEDRPKSVRNPLEQARECMFEVVNQLSRDPQLIFPDGQFRGKPCFPYGHGVVLPRFTRQKFLSTDLGEVIPPELVICKDEMAESVDPMEFQARLWGMFTYRFPSKLSLPQIDRVRWHLFPDVRIGIQGNLFAKESEAEIPDLLKVMDLQQEQLARSLGEGHRIIHGVAGSGKTLILGYRAEHLAKACSRPILVLCYNKALAAKLKAVMESKGLRDKVHVHHFDQWVLHQLSAYNIPTPPRGDSDFETFFAQRVALLISSVDARHVPSGQYDAVLIDEAHDFRPEWLKLVVQMIHPNSRSLLVLYDDAQSIYEGPKKRRFTFSSVGIDARGRTTILRLNYRNTAEILSVARAFAGDLLAGHAAIDDEAPVVEPLTAGRHGPKPVLVTLPNLPAESSYVAQELNSAHKAGRAWGEMAVVYRSKQIGSTIASALERQRIPFEAPQLSQGTIHPAQDSVKLVTMHASKGLEFPVVCIPGLNRMPMEKCDVGEESRLLYVAMTRATESLVITSCGASAFTERLGKVLAGSASG